MAQREPLYPEPCVIMAPLSNYTDMPFRMACRRQGCHYAFSQLVSTGSLTHGNPRCGQLLLRGKDEPWLGVQLFGSSPDKLAEAARILNDHEFDVLDFNMGCPVPKVMKRGAGAALGSNIPLAVACLEALVKTSRFPVTAKIRVLPGKDPEPSVRYALALEAAGIRALTIHGRRVAPVYAGPGAHDIIRAASEALSIPVIANGGAMDRESARGLRLETGCGRIMVARGAIGNPWIFRELLDPAAPAGQTHEEVCSELERHVLDMVGMYGEEHGIVRARKIILSYLTGRGYRRFRRRAVTGLSDPGEFMQLLDIIRGEGPSRRSFSSPVG
ncbi:MAG: tRNA-dihydrouridine synthase family protein [Pseudomonadota bacterium]